VEKEINISSLSRLEIYIAFSGRCWPLTAGALAAVFGLPGKEGERDGTGTRNRLCDL
jgi:hypothetical protein